MKNTLDDYVKDYMEYCKEVIEASSEPTSFSDYMQDGIDNNEPLYHNARDLLDACKAVEHAMIGTQGFAPNFLTNAIKNATPQGEIKNA